VRRYVGQPTKDYSPSAQSLPALRRYRPRNAAQALFVGDDRVNDSGALDTGIPVILVPPARDNDDRTLFMIADWLSGPGTGGLP
jgi:hypothetical protein